jgi:signal transduction histidine kinase
MTDLRGLPRGSKAAAVVILVVLLQVIVVAVLGLGTIARDREEGARLEADDAARRARATSAEAQRDALDGVRSALAKAAAVARGPGGLGNVPRDGWLSAFREVYRVDAEGRVRSAGGTLLHVPPEAVAAEEARYDRRGLDSYLSALGNLREGDPQLSEIRRRLVGEYPFHVADRYATAVGEALALARGAAAAPASAPLPVEDAVVLAWQTAAVNEGRPAARHPGLGWVDEGLDEVVAALPSPRREALAATLAGLRADRKALLALGELALREAQDAAARASPPRVLARDGSLVAVVALPSGPQGEREALLVRLDRSALAALVEGSVSGARLRDAAVSFRALPREEAAESATGSVRLPVADAAVDLGLDALSTPSAAAARLGRAGPRETFYWSILGLAVLGVTAAGVVLWRVLRREVHLARLKADFVSNLSHELKTPLTSISMFTEMIRDGDLAESDALREGIDVISKETERLQRIVTRMIDVARRESGAAEYDLVPGDVNVPVRAACERFRRLTREPGLGLEVSLAPDLPAVAMDAGAVDDAVTNLLSNAWKYRNGDRARVQVASRKAGRGVEISVRDDGIGIPRRERRRVFEMFYRAENYLSRSVPGTGLGLALVRTIVRVHRGKVRVEATPGGGTTFRLRFPRARRPVPPPPKPPAPSGALPEAPAPAAPVPGARDR